MRAVLFRSLAVIGVGATVLVGVLFVASTVDARPPVVAGVSLTQPLAGEDRLALITTSLEIAFSEPVEIVGAAEAVRLEPAAEGAVNWSGSTMIFTPNDPLELETTYALTVAAGIRDLAGNEMSELPPAFEFQTAGRPALADASPADGDADVPLTGPISLTFTTLMDTASVEAELGLRPSFRHELRWSGELLEIVPTQPLQPGQDYEVSIEADAADVAGVTLGEAISLSFRTVAPGLATQTIMPADGVDGIAPTSPIAVIFDRPVDPDSVSEDLLTITPDVAGTLEVVALPDDPADEEGAGRLLRFVPSGPLPANTTFEIELAAGLTSTTGGGLAGPLAWTFTTGAPSGVLSNQIVFISDRGGVPNVWAMNPDGTGQRQVSAELTPVLDYAVAPDGSSLVVGDGRRLVYLRADGGGRRDLTDEGLLEFDATYAPNGQRLAFARADAETGEGLGLWEWQIGGGDATAIELPPELGGEPQPSAARGPGEALRAPRYAPDGQSLAYVDVGGWVGILELPAERLTRVLYDAAAAPIWLPDSSGVILTGARSTRGAAPATPFSAPVDPLESRGGDAVHRLARSGTTVGPSTFGPATAALAVVADGRVAYIDGSGSLWTVPMSGAAPDEPVLAGAAVVAAGFAPGEAAMVIVVDAEDGIGRLELLDLDTGTRTPLAPDGSRPRWLP
jgi:hypothetical protein